MLEERERKCVTGVVYCESGSMECGQGNTLDVFLKACACGLVLLLMSAG